MNQPRILAVGGAHIDRRGQVAGVYVPGASNPGTMGEDVGGGAFNALRVAALRGAKAALMSVRGGDAAGDTVARAVANAGIEDLSVVFLDRTTPSYTALLDREGDVIAALADMGLYELAFPKQMRRSKLREAIAEADAVLTDANLPDAALQRLVTTAGATPVHAIAISQAKAVRLRDVLPQLCCLYMNRREAGALVGVEPERPTIDVARMLRDLGLARAAISEGARPVIAFDETGMFAIDPPAPRRIADVTGAGDAVAGATIVAMTAGQPLHSALREGLAAALLALESARSVPDFSADGFSQALALVPQAREMR